VKETKPFVKFKPLKVPKSDIENVVEKVDHFIRNKPTIVASNTLQYEIRNGVDFQNFKLVRQSVPT